MGLDVVVDYTRLLGAATLTVTGSANFTRTRVDAVHLPATLAANFEDDRLLRAFFFGVGEQNRIERALPRQKGSLAARYSRGGVTGLVRASYYGEVKLRPDNWLNREDLGAKVLLDAEASYQLTRKLRLTVGAENLLNTFPDELTKDANRSFGRFRYSNLSQFGVNGGFYYGKVSLLFF